MWRPTPATIAKLAQSAGPAALGGSGAGTGAWVVFAHVGHGWIPSVSAAAVAVIAIACAAAPKIIRTRGDAKVKHIEATRVSEVQRLLAQTQSALLRQGVDSSKTEQVVRMLSYQLLHEKLTNGQPLKDQALVEVVKEILRAIETPTASRPVAPSHDSDVIPFPPPDEANES